MRKGPVALIILDGFGLREEKQGNAVALADKPTYDRLWQEYPHTTLTASGEAVGLPDGQMGNSEVGHLNIGAGRIVYQNLTRINKSIREADFFENETFLRAVAHAKENDSALHLMGLLSDGGVHSHNEHLYALLQLAKMNNIKKVYVHAFLDGRDVNPQSALDYIEEAETKMKEIGVGKIATVTGRYYAMDRDKRWDRVEKTYRALVDGVALTANTPTAGVLAAYEQNIHDEFIEPFMIEELGKPVAMIEENDAIISFNFRPDRAIQLSRAFTDETFHEFETGKKFKNLKFVTFTHYSDEVVGDIAFDKENLEDTLGEIISNNGLTQVRIAETEKYPHVTFFMSGGREAEFEGEERILIPSPKVATYDLKPEMSAYELTDALVEGIQADRFDAIILNFANPDMVGHSGLLVPTIKAIEAVDECLGRIIDALHAKGGTAIITADHGNADEVLTLENTPMTAHTTNPVPVIVTDKELVLRDGGILADLAPTMLKLLKLQQPEKMTGTPLFK